MKKLKPLYDKLMKTKDENRFKEVGFWVGGPYNRWLVTVKKLSQQQTLRNKAAFGLGCFV